MRSPHTLPLPLALAAATLLPASSSPISVTPPPAPPPETAALAIDTPPGVRLRLEMDARSEDLLGLVKSLERHRGDQGR